MKILQESDMIEALNNNNFQNYVGENIFDMCPVLKDIYYGGDITSWGNLNRDSIHTPPKTIIHCTDGDFKYDAENDHWYEVI